MITFDDYTNQNHTKHNLKWPYIPHHPYRISIIGRSGSGKSLINNQPDICLQTIHMKQNINF